MAILSNLSEGLLNTYNNIVSYKDKVVSINNSSSKVDILYTKDYILIATEYVPLTKIIAMQSIGIDESGNTINEYGLFASFITATITLRNIPTYFIPNIDARLILSAITQSSNVSRFNGEISPCESKIFTYNRYTSDRDNELSVLYQFYMEMTNTATSYENNPSRFFMDEYSGKLMVRIYNSNV
jgi:hypothetical protein